MFAGSRHLARLAHVAALLVVLAFPACREDSRRIALPEVPGGDPERGRRVITAYGCEACHTIPGVPGAHTSVGPPLTEFAYRQFIAGQLVNTPENLVAWIQRPQSIEPGTAMPNLGVTDQDARDIAAYLATLR